MFKGSLVFKQPYTGGCSWVVNVFYFHVIGESGFRMTYSNLPVADRSDGQMQDIYWQEEAEVITDHLHHHCCLVTSHCYRCTTTSTAVFPQN